MTVFYNVTNRTTKKQRYEAVLDYYREKMPRVSTELEFGSVFQLLVATVLSAQCTDKRVNMITPALFGEDVLEYIHSVSYPNSKARHLVALSKMLVDEYGGEVPESMQQLMCLPGVGRKTANVIQAVAFGQSAIAVDTHVFRVSHRLGLVSKTANTPYQVEMELRKNIPAADRADAHHWLLLHGRYICQSRKPHCEKCPFEEICPQNH